ncbi:plasmid recombinant protein (plasmid) [Calothrix sp. NIES-4071]|nr:plasmid recombinant protein [Calothrix sp. NIES-4071]BAZ64346.1 plasmid recombinant protein [Calothrix sp. NIES-4105]
MPYAIARTKKLKKSNIAGSEAHSARLRITPNADSSKKNIRLIGAVDPTERLQDLVLDKIAEHTQKRKIRTDAVYCVELLLTASPTYFRPDDPTCAGYWDEENLNTWTETNLQWLQETYQDKIVRAELHLDEATPHIHAYLVPLDDKGQLRCNHYFDGRLKMQQFQDSYHAAMSGLSLDRGLKGSRAQHLEIKDFYRIVEEGLDLDSNKLSPEQLQAKAADRDRATKRKSEIELTAQQLMKENDTLRAENTQLKQTLNKLRDIPLHQVAWHLGLIKGKDKKWKGEKHSVNIDGSKWYDFHPIQNKGGGGAIDLVMHVGDYSFKQAVAFLNDRFGEEKMLASVTHHARTGAKGIAKLESVQQFEPDIDNKNWDKVKKYLTQERGLHPSLVETFHQQGLIYADNNQNAVFVMRNLEGGYYGAFLRGTVGENNTFMGYAKGTKRDNCWFYFQSGSQSISDVEQAVLCKSPIDALSLAQLQVETGARDKKVLTIYMAADSAESLPIEYLQSIPTVLCAYGNDDAGDSLFSATRALLPDTQQIKPTAIDWNLELLAKQRDAKQSSKSNFQIER